MNKRSLGLAVALLLTTGCASIQSTRTGFDDDVDHQKVALVEYWAKQRGAVVKWVNYPAKRPS